MNDDSSYFRTNPPPGQLRSNEAGAIYRNRTFMRAPLASSLDQVDIG